MGLFLANGTRRAKSAIVTDTPSITDPEVLINEDLYETYPYGKLDPKPEGSILTLKYRAGTVVRQSEIDALYPAATVTTKSPTANLTASATATVTFTGTNLDGVSGITVGGTAATSIVVDSATQLHCTVPAKTAGTYDVVFTDDANTVTKTGFLTYA
jgi:hypothetical protein